MLPEHFAHCPDCVATRAAYERLRSNLGRVSASLAPPPGWQAQVWAAIEGRPPVRRSGWTWRPMAAAAAALVVTALVVGRAPAPAPAVALSVHVEAGATSYRSTDPARPGDVLVLRGRVGTLRHSELRVYQDDARLVLACSASLPCQREGQELQARLTLATIGSYQPVLLLSDEPLPPALGTLDADAGAARRRGARVELGARVTVR